MIAPKAIVGWVLASALGLGLQPHGAHAEPDSPEDAGCMTPCRVARARELIARGEIGEARAELVAAYRAEPRPELLFAIGQLELQLGNYDVAIDYYERFIATGPGEDQVSLAQQAIGAARMRRVQPPSPQVDIAPSPPPRPIGRRRWDGESWGLMALGGLAFATGGGLIFYSTRLADDRSGTLAEYDERIGQARTNRWIGIGVAGAGVIALGAAVVRWRLSLDSEITAATSGGATTVSLRRRW